MISPAQQVMTAVAIGALGGATFALCNNWPPLLGAAFGGVMALKLLADMNPDQPISRDINAVLYRAAQGGGVLAICLVAWVILH